MADRTDKSPDEYPFEVHHKDPNAEDDYGQFRKPSLGGLYDSSAESGSSGTSDRCTTDHTSPQMTARDVGQAEVSEAFALDAGNSMALGLSGEADPFLLRYYQYDDGDMHVSSQTRVRKVVDDLDVPACNDEDQLPRGIPLQFSVVDNEEPVLHGADSSNEACERLGELVPPELESRLLML